MGNTVVSVIIPYMEENSKIVDTLSSVCKQKGFDGTKIEVLIVDVTEGESSRKSTGDLSICKIISTKSVSNEAEACNFAMDYITGEYVTVCRCGDVFGEEYFHECMKAFSEYENVPYVTVKEK